jgi:ParB family chromosome partitioning protein
VGNPLNPRGDIDDELEGLVDTIRSIGYLLQPLMIVSRGAFLRVHPGQADSLGRAKWVVLGGNRRLAAARLAGLRRIDVNEVAFDTEDEFRRAILIENSQRVNLSPLREAEELRELQRKGRTVREVAALIGKSHAYVQQRLDLLKLIPELGDLLESGKITFKAARTIATRAPEVQRAEFEARRQVRDRENRLNDNTATQAAAPASTSTSARRSGRLADRRPWGPIVVELERALMELQDVEARDEVAASALRRARAHLLEALNLATQDLEDHPNG